MCSPSKSRGRPRRPSHRSSRFGMTALTVGRNRIGRVPVAPMSTSSREPTCILPWTRRMNGFHSGNLSKSVRTSHTRSTVASISTSVRSSNIALAEQPGGLQLLRNLLNGLLDIRGLPGARAHELATPEQEDDHLWHVDSVHEAGELFRLVLRPSEGEGDRLEVEFLSQGRRGDDVLNLDFGQSYTTSRCGLESRNGVEY